jgi:type I restriction enzyme S subunit
MSADWPRVPLGDVLHKSDDWIAIDPEVTYSEVTVRLWGKGVTLRREVAGAEIAGTNRLRVRPNQFIASRIDARNGAFGLIPDDLDGAVVTNDFPVFDVMQGRLDPRFLNWMSKTAEFVDLCKAASEGTTNRVRLKEDKFLTTAIPLPPLAEQRRIVDRVEAVAARIAEARRLREEATKDGDRILIQMAHRADLDDSQRQAGGWRLVTLGDVLTQTSDGAAVDSSAGYPNFGIYSFGRGLFPKPPINGLETSATMLYRARAGQFIYSRLFAFEGSYGWVTPEFDGQFVSAEYPMFDCAPGVVRPEFLAAYFKAEHVWAAVAVGSKGLGDRRQRVQPKQLQAHSIWLPPITWQDRIADAWKRLGALRALQSETAAELAALLPAVLAKAFAGAL